MIVLAALEATFGLPLPIFPTVLVLAFRPATPSFVAPFKDLDAPQLRFLQQLQLLLQPRPISETVFVVAE